MLRSQRTGAVAGTAAGTGSTAGPGTARRLFVALSASLLLVGLLSASLWLHGAGVAAAGGPVGPCENTSVCVGVSTPPHGGGSGGGSTGGGGGVPECVYGGVDVPCSNQFGDFDSNDGCYYAELVPQPAAGDPDWQGHQPGDGAIYTRTCPFAPNTAQGNVWMAAGPPAPPIVTPEELAQRALAKIHRTAAKVGTAPSAGGGRTALVGAPIWFWINRTATDYATERKALSATAAVPGLSVTAYVYVTEVDWNLGNGVILTCGKLKGKAANPAGTPYKPSDGAHESPDCGYTYPRPSIGEPGQRYAITATVHWTVTWISSNGGGDTFALDPIATPATTLQVSELQVLN